MTKIRIVTPHSDDVRDMTAEEQALHDTDAIEGVARVEAEEAARVQKATDKASAKAKLIAGEALTEAEADTITG